MTTPPPWHVEKHGGHYEIWPKDKGQTHSYVGTIMTKDDAQLVAAAPKLLAACQELLTAMLNLADNAGDVPEWNKGGFAHKACNSARQLIAKAINL